MKSYTKVLLAVIVFLLSQLTCSLAIGALVISIWGASDQMTQKTLSISLALIVSSIITAYVLWRMHMIDHKTAYRCRKETIAIYPAAFMMAVFGFIATDILAEFLSLPDLVEEDLTALSTSAVGIFSVGLVGPVIEELVFREAIMGTMLREGMKPLLAIVVSALLFGIIHLNPAQVPFAFITGLLLGLIYYKTGSVLLTTLIHALNNVASCLLVIAYAGHPDDATFCKILGGTQTAVICGIIFLVACLLEGRKVWLFKGHVYGS